VPSGLATVFQDRGLSADTSVPVNFAVQQALGVARDRGALKRAAVRRVAVIGPGLDFINKAEGDDFYPEQTIQPFAVIDSLQRLGLAAPDLQLTTLDLSARVNRHLEPARARAGRGETCLLHLPLPAGAEERLEPSLVEYWKRLGDQIGAEEEPIAPPADSRGRVRAVRVRASVARSIAPVDMNVVVERLQLDPGDRFDLIVGTNILVYYSAFEQSLALLNIDAMLGPGGVFLSNTALPATAPAATNTMRVAYSDRQGDHVYWYTK
jgi:hypothetical protein